MIGHHGLDFIIVLFGDLSSQALDLLETTFDHRSVLKPPKTQRWQAGFQTIEKHVFQANETMRVAFVLEISGGTQREASKQE